MSIYPISFINNLSLRRRIEISHASDMELPASRRATVDVVTGKGLAENLAKDIGNDDEAYNYTLENENIEESDAPGNKIIHHTPEESRDKVIPTKFMHFLWFAGLRGAVAYSCARDFPDVYNNKDEVIAATMVIVFLSVIVMGAFCEPLLGYLDIDINVCEKEYMKEWRSRRELHGVMYDLERRFVYDVVVQSDNNSAELNENLDDHSIDVVTELEKSKYPERSMAMSQAIATLTASQYF